MVSIAFKQHEKLRNWPNSQLVQTKMGHPEASWLLSVIRGIVENSKTAFRFQYKMWQSSLTANNFDRWLLQTQTNV